MKVDVFRASLLLTAFATLRFLSFIDLDTDFGDPLYYFLLTFKDYFVKLLGKSCAKVFHGLCF